MAFFKNEEHLYKCLGALFEKVRRDAAIGGRLSAANLIIRFRYEDPAGQITIDLKSPPEAGTYFTAHYGPCDLEPEVEMAMKADIGHRFWHGKVNLVSALTRKQIIAKGPIPKILKLLPTIQPTYKMYPEVLKSIGEAEIVVT